MRYALILVLLMVFATTVSYGHYGYRRPYRYSRRMPRPNHNYGYRSYQKPTPSAQCDPNFLTSRCLAACPAGSLPIIGRPCPNGQSCCT